MADGTSPSAGSSSRDRRRTTVSGPLPLPKRREDGDESSDRGGAPAVARTLKFPWSSPSAPTSPVMASSHHAAAAPPLSPTLHRPPVHKRTLSGNLLAKLSLLRDAGPSDDAVVHDASENAAATTTARPPGAAGSAVSRKSIDDEGASPFSHLKVASALTPVHEKLRKRKGSLRKTALLGGRKSASEGRERKNSLLQRNIISASSNSTQVAESKKLEALHQQNSGPIVVDTTGARSTGANKYDDALALATATHMRRQFSYESAEAMSSSDSGWSIPTTPSTTTDKLSLVTDVGGAAADQQILSSSTPASARLATTTAQLGSPLDLKSPISHSNYASASTTDDDDVLTFHRPAKPFLVDQQQVLSSLPKPLSTAATSYFDSVASVSSSSEVSASLLPLRRRSSKKTSAIAASGVAGVRSSPLSHNITFPATAVELAEHHHPHDYTETEYWGWVILFVTWLTFTVGMGSCLDLWSWAWDVGITPYAPPELEDDPTLPIVGYYPALMVLTGVVAWVWITVAWVGMKYFRHAKIDV